MRKALFCLLLITTLPTAARDVAGVKLPETLEVSEPPVILQLNGAGIRTKFFVKVYVGALYLPTPAHDAKAVLAMPGAKSVTMHFLYDEVSAEKLRSGWTDGFHANQNEAQFKVLADRLEQFNAAFATVHRGDVIRLELLPDTGTAVFVGGKKRATIPGEDFARAVLAIWLGEDPADSSLKDAMLGKDG